MPWVLNRLKRNSLDLQGEDVMFKLFHGKGYFVGFSLLIIWFFFASPGLCDKYVKGLKGIIMSILFNLLLGMHM